MPELLRTTSEDLQTKRRISRLLIVAAACMKMADFTGAHSYELAAVALYRGVIQPSRRCFTRASAP